MANSYKDMILLGLLKAQNADEAEFMNKEGNFA